MTDAEIVTAYSEVLVDWEKYDKKRKYGREYRRIRDLNKTKLAEKLGKEHNLGKTFFVNDHHHHKAFRKVFPNLYPELAKGPQGFGRLGPWFYELQGMLNGTDELTGNVVMQHIELLDPPTFNQILDRL